MNSYNDNEKRIDGFLDDDDISEETIDLFDIAREYGTFIPQDPTSDAIPDEDGMVDLYQMASDIGSASSEHPGVLYFGDEYDDGCEYGYSGGEEADAYPDGFDGYDIDEVSDDSGESADAEEALVYDAEDEDFDEDADEEAYETEEYDTEEFTDDHVFLEDDGAEAFFAAHSDGFDENDYDDGDAAEAYSNYSAYSLYDDEADEEAYSVEDDEEEDGEEVLSSVFEGSVGNGYEAFDQYQTFANDNDAEEGFSAGYVVSAEVSGEEVYEGEDAENDIEDIEDEAGMYAADDGVDIYETATGAEPDSSDEDNAGFIDINSFLIAPDEIYAASDAQSVYQGGQFAYEAPMVFHDAPDNERHGALYYWAKKKTAGGWVKFAAKCFAVLLLAGIVSGVLYFNGLLNLIDFKAASDFEQYYNLSDTDYQVEEDEETVYSTPVYYNESTTIEGFNESMIDIPKKDVLNILLIGTDVRGGTYKDRGNTDSMILVSLNTRDKNIRLTSFMRDMYVDIPGREWQRLNAAYAYGGPQLLFDTLKKNFDVDVDLYVRVNFANFRKIVNHVGGVDIELSEAEAKYMNKYSDRYKTDPVEPGWQHLDGAQALSYARCRKIDSDFNRTKRQRAVILALVKEIKGSSPAELNSLLNVFLPMIQTNMSKMQIISLMTDATRYLNSDIETLNIPIKNSWRSATIRKRSVLCPNFELNKTAITAHIYSTYHLDVENTKYQSFDIPS